MRVGVTGVALLAGFNGVCWGGAVPPWEQENSQGWEGHRRVKRASEKLKRWTVFEGFVFLCLSEWCSE